MIVINHGEEPFVVKRGMRMAQMVVQRILQVEWDRSFRTEKHDKRGRRIRPHFKINFLGFAIGVKQWYERRVFKSWLRN